MVKQNNKAASSIISKTDSNLQARKYAAFSILYLLGIAITITGLILNDGFVVNASSDGANGGPGSNLIDILLLVFVGMLTIAFIAITIFYVTQTKKKS